MILVTRLNGAAFALNPDLIERADCTPDSVITLVDGTKYVISESLPEFIEIIRRYRASIIAEAQDQVSGAPRHRNANKAVRVIGKPHPHHDEDGTDRHRNDMHHTADGHTDDDSHRHAPAKVVQLHPRDS